MIVDADRETKKIEVENSADRRRRITDVAQPLDYVAQELVGEFIENTHKQSPPSKSFIRKLFNMG